MKRLYLKYKKIGFYSLLVSYLIAFLVFLPYLLQITLPEKMYIRYVEGLTPIACETGKSTIPWGSQRVNKESCYLKLKMCDKLTKEYDIDKCLNKPMKNPGLTPQGI
jgi:hypothetical protein